MEMLTCRVPYVDETLCPDCWMVPLVGVVCRKKGVCGGKRSIGRDGEEIVVRAVVEPGGRRSTSETPQAV